MHDNEHVYLVLGIENQLKQHVAKPEELKGATPEENAELIVSILKGTQKGAKRDIACINAGAALYIDGTAKTIAEGAKMAADIVDSGKAYEKLQEIIKFSNSIA